MDSTAPIAKRAGQPRIRALVSRFARERDGVAAIEFAMLAIPFFLFVFAILESCLSFAAQQVLSNAMDTVARQVRTGQETGLIVNPGKLRKEICDRIEIIVSDGCPGLFVDLRAYTTFQKASADGFTLVGAAHDIKIVSNGAQLPLEVKPGGAKTINTMRVFYKWPVITDMMRKYMSTAGNGNTLLFATTTWQNEPY